MATKIVNLKVRDVARWHAAIARRVPALALKANEKTAREAKAYLRERVASMPNPPIDKRKYLNGWIITHPRPGVVRVSNRYFYGIVIEKGRRPGARRPPAKALEPWVRRKLGVSRKQAKGVAFVVARAIGRRGLRPRRVVFGAMPRIVAIHRNNVQAAYRLALEGGF